ncbi:MAG TPA: redoxin domain-containing protein [Solirubrobacteraceae bacterium]|jgi:peroxiredoxin
MTPSCASSSEEVGSEEAPLGDVIRAREEARRLIDGLLRRQIPSLVLPSTGGAAIDVRDLGQGQVVFYLYPGSPTSPDDGADTPMVDAVQHRAFRDHLGEMTARHVNVAGISSQPLEVQYRGAKANQLTQTLLTDPECQLAEALELPTFMLEGAKWYRRLTLIVSAGRINKVFFPVSAARNADQVLAWMKVQAS